MKNFSGKILFLDRSDINTDEIIPAKYLTEISKEALKPHLLEDLDLDSLDVSTDIADCNVIITRENFGCGSSREHAPWALEVNDINLVIAVNFARIFKQNMFNNGMMAIELDAAVIDTLFKNYAGKPCILSTDMENNTFSLRCEGETETIPFSLSLFDRELVTAGGWVNYADSRY